MDGVQETSLPTLPLSLLKNGKISMKSPKVLVVGPSMDSSEVAQMFIKEGWTLASASEEPDLVCFTGGADVNPRLYNEEEHHTAYIDEERDATEQKVFEKYERYPKVGICRGGQFLNVMSGGEMWQNVNKHGVYGTHAMVDLITGEFLEVTSTHHQMMIPHKDGETLAIAFEASLFEGAHPNQNREIPKHDTEVVWYRSTNSLCFQPHPEYNYAPKECTAYFFGLIQTFWNLKGVTKKAAA